MRLPSASYDQQEFLQGITEAGEDTSNLVEAHDYLHPGESGVRAHRVGPGGQHHLVPHQHLNGGVSQHPHHFMNGMANGGLSPPRRQLSNQSSVSLPGLV